jgi:NAD(P)-dependent dehydrogenase (short-subunit alcohol dehydrogenase family)
MITPMTGKRVIITGPTSGIGRQIALDLAALGAHVVLACRDVARGDDVAREISKNGGTGEIDVLQVDTSDQRSIHAFAATCRVRHPNIDVLVNNAGTVQGERRESADGIEMTFATNVLGYHLLTRELLPAFNGETSRIVVVASAFAGDLDFDDLQFTRRRFDGLAAYRQSKACDRVWSWALARRVQSRGITVNAMTPGFVPDTELSRHLSTETRQARARAGRTVKQGADTAVWMANDPALSGVTSRFFVDRRDVPCEFKNAGSEERLWQICEGLVGAAG